MLLRAVAAILFLTCAVQITTTLPVRTCFYSQTTDLTRITFEVSMHICIFVVLSFQVRLQGTGLSLQGFSISKGKEKNSRASMMRLQGTGLSLQGFKGKEKDSRAI